MPAVCDEHGSHSFKSDGLPAHRPWMHEVMLTKRQKISGRTRRPSISECTWYSCTHMVSAVSTRRVLSFWIIPVRPMTTTWFWGSQTGPTETTLADGREWKHVHISVQLLASLLRDNVPVFSYWQTVTFWRASKCLNDESRGDFVYTCFKRSNAKWQIEHQKFTWSFWNLDQYLCLLLEYLLLHDNFVIGSLQGMPQSDYLPVPALTGKPNDG